MEHRYGQRRDINRTVHLQAANGVAATGRITNVSMSGAFVVSALPPRLLSHVQVQFSTLQHGKRTLVSVEAQIVRKGPRGFAIEWSEIDPHAIRALTNTSIDVPVPARRQQPSGSAALLSSHHDRDR